MAPPDALPPPVAVTVLPETVELVSVNVPEPLFTMPPAQGLSPEGPLALLPEITLPLIVMLPELPMPAPKSPAPPVMLSEFRLERVMPFRTIKTLLLFAPLTVTRFLSVAPEPEVGPLTMVLAGRVRNPFARLIVFCAAVLLAENSVESNVMLAEPFCDE